MGDSFPDPRRVVDHLGELELGVEQDIHPVGGEGSQPTTDLLPGDDAVGWPQGFHQAEKLRELKGISKRTTTGAGSSEQLTTNPGLPALL